MIIASHIISATQLRIVAIATVPGLLAALTSRKISGNQGEAGLSAVRKTGRPLKKNLPRNAAGSVASPAMIFLIVLINVAVGAVSVLRDPGFGGGGTNSTSDSQQVNSFSFIVLYVI